MTRNNSNLHSYGPRLQNRYQRVVLGSRGFADRICPTPDPVLLKVIWIIQRSLYENERLRDQLDI